MQWLGSLVFTVFLFLWTGCYAVFFVAAASLLPFRGRAVLASQRAVNRRNEKRKT